MADYISNAGYVPVPADFIETKMAEANGAYVKVYLYMLSLAVKGKSVPNSEIAQKLHLLESDVVNAIKYWNDNNSPTVPENTNISENKPSADPVSPPSDTSFSEIVSSVGEKKHIKDIAETLTNNKTLADICTVSQEILGKTLNNNEIETLYWFYDTLGLSAEVISMLLEYCVSKGKRNMSYIEKIALSWHENGITTMAAADNFISEDSEKTTFFYQAKKIFGIGNRNLTKSEELYIKTWFEEYDMSIEMISLAYDYCIMQTSKLSFPYMNKIIKTWYEQNIRTPEQATEDHEKFKTKNKKFTEKDTSVYNPDDYDYDDIERMMREKYNKQ